MKTLLFLLFVAAGLTIAMPDGITPTSTLATWWPVGLSIGGIALGMMPGAARKKKMPKTP